MQLLQVHAIPSMPGAAEGAAAQYTVRAQGGGYQHSAGRLWRKTRLVDHGFSV